MCGRYWIQPEDDEVLAVVIDTLNRRGVAVKQGEVCPTDIAPVIANNRSMKPVPFGMKWGFARENGSPIINARSETADEKPMFRDSFRTRRCLIPASCYFEWAREQSGKPKYAIGRGKPIYMAGLYRLENERPSFVVLTKACAPSIAFIHPRMPVILPDTAADAWLSADADPKRIIAMATEDVTAELASGQIMI